MSLYCYLSALPLNTSGHRRDWGSQKINEHNDGSESWWLSRGGVINTALSSWLCGIQLAGKSQSWIQIPYLYTKRWSRNVRVYVFFLVRIDKFPNVSKHALTEPFSFKMCCWCRISESHFKYFRHNFLLPHFQWNGTDNQTCFLSVNQAAWNTVGSLYRVAFPASCQNRGLCYSRTHVVLQQHIPADNWMHVPAAVHLE